MTAFNIPFNRATLMGNEMAYITQAVANGHVSGNGVLPNAATPF